MCLLDMDSQRLVTLLFTERILIIATLINFFLLEHLGPRLLFDLRDLFIVPNDLDVDRIDSGEESFLPL